MFEDDASKDYSKTDGSEGIQGELLNLSVLASGEKIDGASGENGEATSSDLVDVCLDLMMYKDAKLSEYQWEEIEGTAGVKQGGKTVTKNSYRYGERARKLVPSVCLRLLSFCFEI